jgi:hypothetical protein
VPSTTRDKDATWRGIGYYADERGWSKPRVIQEVQNGLPIRTQPEGHEHEIDWHDPNVTHHLNLETSELSSLGPDFLTVGIEVRTDAVPERKPKLKRKPKRKPAKRVFDKDLRNSILAIKDEHPDDPLDEEKLWEAVENDLGLPVARDRVRAARKKVAPQWVNPVGRPRK